MTREFSRSIKSKGIIISETTPCGWHGIKQPSGTHNTINYFANPGFPGFGRIFRRGSGADCKSVAFGLGWFDSIFSHYLI